MYYAYVGVYKNGGSKAVIEALAIKGLTKWQDNVEEMVKTKNTDQLCLLIAMTSLKDAYKQCYEICAKHGWPDSALWLYTRHTAGVHAIKECVLIHPGALDIAYEHQQLSFIDKVIVCQQLYRFQKDNAHTQWGVEAGVLTKEPMKECSGWWVNWIVACIKHVGSHIIKGCKLPYRLLLTPLMPALFKCWYKRQVGGVNVMFDELVCLEWILGECGKLNETETQALVTNVLINPVDENTVGVSHVIHKLIGKSHDESEKIRIHCNKVYCLFQTICGASSLSL